MKLKAGSIVQLTDNYRSHPLILKLYSQMFYSGSLIAQVDPSNCPEDQHLLSKFGNIPLLFKHINGVEARDEDSPSWHNQAEMDEVAHVVSKLVKSGCAPEEIGIIAPYQKQVQKLQSFIYNNRHQFAGVVVGTVEFLQGSKRRVIVITTVRSREHDRVETTDRKYRLGFLHNQKRLNVSISRAKAMLIIVGNAELLFKHDRHFEYLIRFFDHHGACEGPEFFDNEFFESGMLFEEMESKQEIFLSAKSLALNEVPPLSDAEDAKALSDMVQLSLGVSALISSDDEGAGGSSKSDNYDVDVYHHDVLGKERNRSDPLLAHLPPIT